MSVLAKKPMSWVALGILLFWATMIVCSYFFSDFFSMEQEISKRLEPPGAGSLLGFDSLGVPLHSQLAKGAVTSLSISLITTFLCYLIACPLGMWCGYRGGWADSVVSRVCDILLSFPPLILPIAITTFFGSGRRQLILALVLGGWVSVFRLVRSQIRSFWQLELVTASIAMGASTLRIMFVHAIPHLYGALSVHLIFMISGMILAESSLSFLGLGFSEGDTSWGTLLNDGRSYITDSPHVLVIPAIALVSIVLSLNIFGELLRKKS